MLIFSTEIILFYFVHHHVLSFSIFIFPAELALKRLTETFPSDGSWTQPSMAQNSRYPSFLPVASLPSAARASFLPRLSLFFRAARRHSAAFPRLGLQQIDPPPCLTYCNKLSPPARRPPTIIAKDSTDLFEHAHGEGVRVVLVCRLDGDPAAAGSGSVPIFVHGVSKVRLPFQLRQI